MKDINIGFIGLGNVGSKIAFNILSSNLKYKLHIYDIDKKKSSYLVKKGAINHKSIRNLLNQTSIFFTCLPSPKSVSNVIESNRGVLKYIKKNHLWIEMSTTDEMEMKRLAKLIESKGASVLEAPITGGQHKAESGNISILVGGKKNNFKRAFTILSAIGSKILYCGNIGNASTLKVVTNYLASINLLSLGEALMICKKYGIDLKKAYKGIKISSGNSFVHESESQLILNGSYDVGFTMDLVCKDIGLFQKLAEEMHVPTKLSPLMINIFNEGKKKYGNRSYSTSIVKLLEDKCKINLRSKGFPSKLIDKTKKQKAIEI